MTDVLCSRTLVGRGNGQQRRPPHLSNSIQKERERPGSNCDTRCQACLPVLSMSETHIQLLFPFLSFFADPCFFVTHLMHQSISLSLSFPLPLTHTRTASVSCLQPCLCMSMRLSRDSLSLSLSLSLSAVSLSHSRQLVSA